MATWFDPWTSEPWEGFERLRRELDQAFDRFGSRSRGWGGTPYPPVNVYETQDGYVLTAEMPGLRREDLDISIEGRKVTLRGERKIEYPEAGRTSLHRRERQAGIFRRTLELPLAAYSERCEASYRDGVLTLRIPKAPEHQPRRIEVRGS